LFIEDSASYATIQLHKHKWLIYPTQLITPVMEYSFPKPAKKATFGTQYKLINLLIPVYITE